MVVEALRQMRDNRVRSVLVIDDDVLVGIVTQVTAPSKCCCRARCEADAGGPSNDGQPGDGPAGRSAGRLHRNHGCARFSPSASARRGQVVGVIRSETSSRTHPGFEHNVDDLMGYIMKDGPGG